MKVFHKKSHERLFLLDYRLEKYNKQTYDKQTSNTQPFVWTKTRLQAFERDYWQQFSGIDKDGQPCVYLTYDVLIVDAHLP